MFGKQVIFYVTKSSIDACKVIIKLLKIPIENCIQPQFVKPESVQVGPKAQKRKKT